MIYSKKSWHFRIYRDVYNITDYDIKYNGLPKSFCSYFWKLVFAILVSIILLPFSLPPLLFSERDSPAWIRSAVTISVISVLFILLGFIHGIYEWYKILTITKYQPTDTIVIPFILILLGLIYLISYIKEKIESSFTNKPVKTTILGTYIKSKSEKICPKIEWID